MRNTALILAAVVLAAAITFALLPQAVAGDSPPLIEFLAKKAGAGQSAATQNAYNSYLLNRFIIGRSPDGSLEYCQKIAIDGTAWVPLNITCA